MTENVARTPADRRTPQERKEKPKARPVRATDLPAPRPPAQEYEEELRRFNPDLGGKLSVQV
ncbi:MAG: hypothetical protein HY608_03490 [Planctomycetes bacterium]|nr:hypothetical protein [Planctomycetota bacterium]